MAFRGIDGFPGISIRPFSALLDGDGHLRRLLSRIEGKEEARPALSMGGVSNTLIVPALVDENLAVRLRLQEAEAAAAQGAGGVGLFRTEFLFMNAPAMPGEEEQFRAYREAAAAMDGRPVIIRTMDIGGDKALPYLDLPREDNPFLGYRAIRIGLGRQELLKVQLRAVLRASALGNVKVMFPMISGLQEWREAKGVLEEAKEELKLSGAAFDERIEAGIMVEVPSAAVMAGAFAREVDFFSIGTNDLVQYTLAVDRMNDKVAYLYDYFHPAVLQLIRQVIEASHRAGKWTGMCGGMAGDPLAAPLLLGLGLDEWSMEAGRLGVIKKELSALDREACRSLADSVLTLDTPQAVRQALEEFRRAIGHTL